MIRADDNNLDTHRSPAPGSLCDSAWRTASRSATKVAPTVTLRTWRSGAIGCSLAAGPAEGRAGAEAGGAGAAGGVGAVGGSGEAGWAAVSPGGRCCRGPVPARNHCCHSAVWQLPQQVWRCRLRPKGGHQLLDLILGSPRSAVQDLGRVRFVEHVAQLDEGGEVQSAVGEVFGDDGKTRQQPRGRGATKPSARTVLRRSSSARRPSSSTSRLRSCLRISRSRVVSAWSGRSARNNIILLYCRVFPPRLAHQAALTATISRRGLHRPTAAARPSMAPYRAFERANGRGRAGKSRQSTNPCQGTIA